ncbi:MAG TPA: 4-hydroxy-tetrahydrodipicolinate reductase [Firmicutes bacterium]|nr:4-hydroxy-tetrahydrodipicolinate reductase [Bacillota bacterium]
MTIKVAVNGALGRMGRTVVAAVSADPELQLVAAVDTAQNKDDAGHTLPEMPGRGIARELEPALQASRPDVLIDFTSPFTVMQNIEIALKNRVRPVVGTTGITASDLEKIRSWSLAYGTSALIAPNFAIGAVLMMHFAQLAARYLPEAEIIELHHEKKIDAPSGTAIKTAEMIVAARSHEVQRDVEELEKVEGARGGNFSGIRIHSVRLPGFVAHQEVIFGGMGQTLTIRHDSTDRTSFMPGVLLAVREIMKRQGVIYGLENILNL